MRVSTLALLSFLFVGCGPLDETRETSGDLSGNSFNFKNTSDASLEVGSSKNNKQEETVTDNKPELSENDAKEILFSASEGKGEIESIVLDTYDSKIAYHLHVIHKDVPYDIFIDANDGKILNPWVGQAATISMTDDGKIVCKGGGSLF